MTSMMFSSAEYIRELRTSGFSQEQSETISKGIESIREDMNQLATKEDLRELKDDVKELKNETQSLRKELHEGINGVRAEPYKSINVMRAELRESTNELRTEIKNFKDEILAKLKQAHENILHRWIAQSSVLIMTATVVIISTIALMHR
jgi:uncharacterized coiled-coil DUF342 family protein